jgi:hypothetical protein
MMARLAMLAALLLVVMPIIMRLHGAMKMTADAVPAIQGMCVHGSLYSTPLQTPAPFDVIHGMAKQESPLPDGVRLDVCAYCSLLHELVTVALVLLVLAQVCVDAPTPQPIRTPAIAVACPFGLGSRGPPMLA